MKLPADDDLILHFYGESDRAEEIDGALEHSAELRERYEQLRRILEAVEEPTIPEPSPFLAARIWANLEPEAKASHSRRWQSWLQPRREWALIATMLLVAAVSFVVGRQSSQPAGDLEASLVEARQRILLVTVAGHLERSEILLLELANTQQNGDYDLTSERDLAAELKGDNRLYRLAAEKSGKPEVASLLGDLEQIFLELAHSPADVASSDLGELRLRLEQQDLLFKVRIVGSQLLQESQDKPAPLPPSGAGRNA